MRDRDQRGGEGDEREHARAGDDPPLPAQRGRPIRMSRDQQQGGATDEPDGGDQVQKPRGDAESVDRSGLSARC